MRTKFPTVRLRLAHGWAAGLLALMALSGCLSPDKRVERQIPELRTQWQTSAVHQASLPERVLDWNAALVFLRDHNLALRRARIEITNAHENYRQIFKDLLPQINLRSGISQSIGEISGTTWDDVIFDVYGFLNVPGFVSLNTRHFAARLTVIRAYTLYELVQRERTIELYRLMLTFAEHQDALAALEIEQRFAAAVRSADDVIGQVLLRDAEQRNLSLMRERDALQARAGDLFGDRRWHWTLSTNGVPAFAYDVEPLPVADTNRIAQVQLRLVAIELVAAWARVTGIKLQYWPEARLVFSAPPLYRRRAGDETFFDAEDIRLTADVFWRLDTRGQVSKQLRQTRRDQELQIARIRQESLALIDRILTAQRLLEDLRTEIAELNQLIPIVEGIAPQADFTSIVSAAETRRSLRDQERRLRREVAELNTLFWFVDEQKWSQREEVF